MDIGIIGCGTMGIGIAQVAAAAGNQVCIYDVNMDYMKKSLDKLKNVFQRLVEKGKMTSEEAQAILSRIKPVNLLGNMAYCSLFIEAIVEDKTVKDSVFKELEKSISKEAIIATNTSSISITSLQSGLQHPERFIGIHFFNPAPLMPLVEIIPGLLTDEKLPNKIIELMKTWGKTPVIAKDAPGFIVNRIARPFYGEALRLVEENIATPEQVDDAMKTLGDFRMGPFELMDLIGVDVNFSVTQTVFEAFFYDQKYTPSLLQQRMSEAKLLGRKTGKGFYDYSDGAVNPQPVKDEELYNQIFMRIIAMLINEAVEAKRLNIASDEDIELAMQKGVNYPKGLLAWGKELGYSRISEVLDRLYKHYQEDRYRQSPLLRELN